MKIAVASDDGKVIASHFGRTKGFVVFEVDGKEIKSREYLPNTFTGHARGCHEEGSHHWRRIYNDLKASGIEVYVTEETDVDKALKLFLDGKLTNVEDLID